jgi:hypothetical protein
MQPDAPARDAAPAVLDLRGVSAGAAAPVRVLEDPTGRRARHLARTGRLIGVAAALWMVLLVVGGLGLLPATGIPFRGLLLPTAKSPAPARPQPEAAGLAPATERSPATVRNARADVPGAQTRTRSLPGGSRRAEDMAAAPTSTTAAPPAAGGRGRGRGSARGTTSGSGRSPGSAGTAPGSGKQTGASGRAPGSGKATGSTGTAPGSGRQTGASGLAPGSQKQTGSAASGRSVTQSTSSGSDGPSATTDAATSGGPAARGSVRSRSARDAGTLSGVTVPTAD